MEGINETLKLLIQLANTGELNPWGVCSVYLLVGLLIIRGGVVFLLKMTPTMSRKDQPRNSSETNFYFNFQSQTSPQPREAWHLIEQVVRTYREENDG